MLEQIEVVKEDADLQAEFTKRENGMFSKEGSARLLVELDKFRDLCKQFYGSLDDARKVRGMLDSYIETITQRNRHIDYYNLLVAALLDLAAEVDKLNLQRRSVQGAIASKTQPGVVSGHEAGAIKGVQHHGWSPSARQDRRSCSSPPKSCDRAPVRGKAAVAPRGRALVFSK
jgi:hypothetical protein